MHNLINNTICLVPAKFFSSLFRTRRFVGMEQLSDIRGNLFWILNIPGDGDCLFGAIVHQIYGMTPKHRLFKTYSQLVREAAVTEIIHNLHLYYETVSSTANEVIASDCSVSDKVEEYLSKLKTTGYWGGSDSIAALSNHFQVYSNES